jgi:hypothetical protein
MDFRPIIVARDRGTRCSSSSTAEQRPIFVTKQPNSERGIVRSTRDLLTILGHFEAGSSLNRDFITAPFNHPGLS